MAKEKVQQDEDLLVDENVDENEIYVTYDIASYPSDLTLSVVREMWGDGNRDIIIPDFQRNFVWSIKQASLLIESFLLGLPAPAPPSSIPALEEASVHLNCFHYDKDAE